MNKYINRITLENTTSILIKDKIINIACLKYDVTEENLNEVIKNIHALKLQKLNEKKNKQF